MHPCAIFGLGYLVPGPRNGFSNNTAAKSDTSMKIGRDGQFDMLKRAGCRSKSEAPSLRLQAPEMGFLRVFIDKVRNLAFIVQDKKLLGKLARPKKGHPI